MISPNKKAQQVLNFYWDGHLPVDVASIAEKSGIKVKYDYPETENNYDVSGKIEKLKDGGVLISLSELEDHHRQRFVLAYELGHYFMGHVQSCIKDTFDFSLHTTSKEKHQAWAAGEFAASLLIPQETLYLVTDKMERPTVEKLAEVFCVSHDVMQMYLMRPGVL